MKWIRSVSFISTLSSEMVFKARRNGLLRGVGIEELMTKGALTAYSALSEGQTSVCELQEGETVLTSSAHGTAHLVGAQLILANGRGEHAGVCGCVWTTYTYTHPPTHTHRTVQRQFPRPSQSPRLPQNHCPDSLAVINQLRFRIRLPRCLRISHDHPRR